MVPCRVLNPGPKEVAQQAISKLGGPPDFLGGDVEGEAARESARMKERANSGPASPSVSLAAKQDVLEQSNFAGDSDWGCAARAEYHLRLQVCAMGNPAEDLSALMNNLLILKGVQRGEQGSGMPCLPECAYNPLCSLLRYSVVQSLYRKYCDSSSLLTDFDLTCKA